MRQFLLALFLLLPTAAFADTIQLGESSQWVFSGETCTGCFPQPNQLRPIVTFSGIMTLTPTKGQFYEPVFGISTSTVLMVTDLSGTLTIDCNGVVLCSNAGTWNMSFAPARNGDGSYANLNGFFYYLQFSMDGSGANSSFFYDHNNQYLTMETTGTVGYTVAVHINTVQVPEIPSLALLPLGMMGIAGFAFVRRRVQGSELH